MLWNKKYLSTFELHFYVVLPKILFNNNSEPACVKDDSESWKTNFDITFLKMYLEINLQ